MVTDRTNEGIQAVWVVDELIVPKPHPSKNESRAEEEKLIKEKFLEGRRPPSFNLSNNKHNVYQMSFWDKYFEMQYHMITAHSTMGDHTFAADPANWPLMGKSLPYWLDETSNAQINLLGNPLLWWISTASVMAFTALLVFYLMRRRRQVYDLTHSKSLYHMDS